MAKNPPRRRFRAVAIVVAALLAAAAAEVILRLTHWGVYERRWAEYHFVRRPEDPFWTFDPSAPPEHAWDGDPYGRLPPGARMTYSINWMGMRGRTPVPGRPAVLFVGDSFTFGEGVAEDETFVAQVERVLATRLSPPPQALNGGVPGYGTEQEAGWLPTWLARLRPQAVVVVFVPNDPIELSDSMGRDDLLQAPDDKPTSYLGRLVSSVAGRFAANRETEAWYESYYTGERRERWEAARRGLLDMKQRSEAAGARFGVVIFPLIHRLSERPFARIHQAVAAACHEMGAPVLDLTDALAVEPDHALWVHPTDHHPDARAHALVTDPIASFVESLLR